MDQSQPRNDNNQTQNDNGGGNQRIPPPNPPPPRLAHRILIVPNLCEIVGVLSATATRYGQAFYITQGTGYVSHANFVPLETERFPSERQQFQNVRAQIDHLSGWFFPRLTYQEIPLIPSNLRILQRRLDNGGLYVSFRHESVPQGVSLATALIATGPVEATVHFVYGPGSIIQPYAPGGPRDLYTIHAQPE